MCGDIFSSQPKKKCAFTEKGTRKYAFRVFVDRIKDSPVNAPFSNSFFQSNEKKKKDRKNGAFTGVTFIKSTNTQNLIFRDTFS